MSHQNNIKNALAKSGVNYNVPAAIAPTQAECTGLFVREGLPYRLMYMLLRSLSKTENVWNAWFSASANRQTDQFAAALAYATGEHAVKIDSIATQTKNPDQTNIDPAQTDLQAALEFFSSGTNFKTLVEKKETGSNLLLFDSTALRKHIDAIVKSKWVRFRDCRQVKYRMTSMNPLGPHRQEEGPRRALPEDL